MEEAILTIILITYNHKDTIKKCLDSILSQKTNYKYEIHITDDASTDGTSDICREYGAKYPDKIKLFIQEKNTYGQGPETFHVCKAYRRLSTKYWCYIEGDDYLIDDNKIQLSIQKLEEHPDCFTVGHNTIMRDKEGKETLIVPEIFKEGVYDSFEIPFIHPTGRIHRTIKGMWDYGLQGDGLIYWYYQAKGKTYYIDKPMSVYNFNNAGVWSSLDDRIRDRQSRLSPFRLCQFTNFENEKVWRKLLVKKDRKMVNFFSFFMGAKAAWYLWYIVKFVPDFGWNSIDPYSRRKK